jgi:hypothetical protein
MVSVYRPLRDEYLAIAKLLQSDIYLKLEEDSFISEMIRLTNGNTTANRARQIYYSLIREVVR